MIRAIIFDLDGTLVETEELKALSYAIKVLFESANFVTARDLHSLRVIAIGEACRGSFKMTDAP